MDKCPKCGSEEVGCEDDEFYEGEDYSITMHHMECFACGHHWTISE